MRIIHVLNHCKHGHGNAHVAVDLACAQSAAGHEVYYVSEGGDYEELLAQSGVTHLRLVQNLRNPFLGMRALARLWVLCRRIKPDILHAHMMSGAVLGYLVSRLVRSSLVTTVHNSFDTHSVLMRLGDLVVAVSGAERASLIKRGFKESRMAVVLNGPNESPRERSTAAAAPVSFVRPCITTICGIHKRKGVADLLAAFCIVNREAPEWRLNVVGEGPDKTAMIELAGSLGLSSRVTFHGNLPSAAPVLANSDIFVLASYADPCSLAVAEARYAGCAVIATAVGGTPELLGSGENGLLVNPGDPEGLAAAIMQVAADAGTLREWRRRSKAGADYLVVERVHRDYLAVYLKAKEMR